MSALYQVKRWDENFENNRTRNMKQMLWVPVPNKHDGDGYTELVDRENGASMLGAWLAILQVASKCGKRGTLMRDSGTPHAPKSIARLTRLDSSVIAEALDLLCSPDIGWLEVVDSKSLAGGCGIPAPSAHPTDEEGREGKEEKRRKETTTGGAVDLSSKHPEFTQLQECEPLSKITIERYISIKHAFPKVNASQAVFLACLKAGDPDSEVKRPDGFLRSQFQYAPEADPREIPYAFGGKKIRLELDGTQNKEDRAAFRKAVC